MKQSFDATISALDAETSALDVETSAFVAATSAIARRSFDTTVSALDAETSSLDAETSAIARSYQRPYGIFLPRTELLQSPFRTEFSMGSRSRRYRRSLRRHRQFLRSYRRFLWSYSQFLQLSQSLRRSTAARAPMRRRRSLRDSLNIIKHC